METSRTLKCVPEIYTKWSKHNEPRKNHLTVPPDFAGYDGFQGTGKLRLVPGWVIWRQDGRHHSTLKLPISDIVKITCTKVPRSCCFDIQMKDGNIYSFRGFKNMDRNEVINFFNEHGIQVVEEELAISGKNWGELDITGHRLSMTADKKTLFRLPLGEVSNVKVLDKNEVTLEFHKDDLMRAHEKDGLAEMTFHFPDNGPVSGVEEVITPADAFKKLLDSKEGIGYSADGDALVEFDSIDVLNLMAPSASSFKMHLKHFILEHNDRKYKIMYQSVVSVIVVQKKSTRVVIGIHPSLVIDQTRIRDIVIKFPKNVVVHKELSVNGKLFEEKLKGKVDKSYQGFIQDVFIRVFGGLSGVVPTYVSGCLVKSCFKNKEGDLFLLEDRMLFVPTPSTEIPHDEILDTEILGLRGGSFDISIQLKTKDNLVITEIRRKDLKRLLDYMKYVKRFGNLNA
ncbi:FACT complex subunit SSRP1 [Artemisia annua]|uniref:FACT complex subunit SSRP1 n=1 Tax=Artemisia annua TaxID=35608 RepID=A0A2U1PJ27_ARTAN|nr:FACT complex subunit SSRP1 [Artemisia annua]